MFNIFYTKLYFLLLRKHAKIRQKVTPVTDWLSEWVTHWKRIICKHFKHQTFSINQWKFFNLYFEWNKKNKNKQTLVNEFVCDWWTHKLIEELPCTKSTCNSEILCLCVCLYLSELISLVNKGDGVWIYMRD